MKRKADIVKKPLGADRLIVFRVTVVLNQATLTSSLKPPSGDPKTIKMTQVGNLKSTSKSTRKSLHGICVECGRNMYGIRMEYVWNMHGIRMERVWNMHGLCMEYGLNMYGICMEYVWNMYGRCMECVCNLPILCSPLPV